MCETFPHSPPPPLTPPQKTTTNNKEQQHNDTHITNNRSKTATINNLSNERNEKAVSETTYTYTELVEHYKDSQWKYTYIYRACGTLQRQSVKIHIHIQSLWNITKTVSENTHTYTELVEYYKDSQWKYAYIYRACGTLQRQSVKIRIHIQSLWNITKTVSENTHTYTELVEHYKDSQWKYT